MKNDHETEADDLDSDVTDNDVNAQPVHIPLTQKERVCRSLKSTYDAAFEAAELAGEWKNIIAAKVPAAALELFCITATAPTIKDEAAIVMLKRVKKHLIRLNLTVLDAYEKRMLGDAIAHVIYQDETFGVWVNRETPDSGEAGWEDRVESAQARLDAYNAQKESEELPEAV